MSCEQFNNKSKNEICWYKLETKKQNETKKKILKEALINQPNGKKQVTSFFFSHH